MSEHVIKADNHISSILPIESTQLVFFHLIDNFLYQIESHQLAVLII